jgi:ATP-dependent Clp protease adapter protein ClpS
VLLTVASGYAHRLGDRRLRPAHLLLAALFHDEVAELIEACGADSAALRRALQTHVEELAGAAQAGASRPVVAAPSVEISPEAAEILRTAGRWAGRQGASPVAVLEAIVRVKLDDYATALLDGAGVSARLVEARGRDRAKAPSLVEGAAAPYRRAPGPPLFDVVLWNDSRSTMEGVLRVLTESFEMDAVEALHVMISVHHLGQATVRRYPEGEALLVAERALTLARELGMPLQITTTADTRS